jgi:hypothetical protein
MRHGPACAPTLHFDSPEYEFLVFLLQLFRANSPDVWVAGIRVGIRVVGSPSHGARIARRGLRQSAASTPRYRLPSPNLRSSLKPLVHRHASWTCENGESPARSVGFVGTVARPAVDRWPFTFVLLFVQQTSPASFIDLFSTSKRSLPDDVAREPGTLKPADSAEYAHR